MLTILLAQKVGQAGADLLRIIYTESRIINENAYKYNCDLK